MEQACKQLDDYICEKGPYEQASILYRHLIQEMEARLHKQCVKNILNSKNLIYYLR
ncbi:hypothetical protein [Rickettsiella grylli]|uniref:Uncharacterized protein n=1 Tax=Rickettsiella grylli TaxID=59196 RepID=A8PLG2_9COXI|nr:hypothetical protein [Rickettsiella grylli]EDP46419.1 hypothetical protein RICGR_0418 [Rickettsiella grylli]